MSFHGIPLSELCNIAAGTPPDGQVSNLVDPPTLAPLVWGLSVFMTVWALSFTLARIYMNFHKLRASDCTFIFVKYSDGSHGAPVSG